MGQQKMGREEAGYVINFRQRDTFASKAKTGEKRGKSRERGKKE